MVVIERKKRVIIPEPGTTFETGDKVMGVVRTTSLKKVRQRFHLS